MKASKSRSEASLAPAPTQYSSTPHLFVFQSNEDAAVLKKPEPIYQSAADIRAGRRLSAAQAISEKYDSYHSLAREDEPLAVDDADVAQIEAFFSGHKTQVGGEAWVAAPDIRLKWVARFGGRSGHKTQVGGEVWWPP